MPTLPPAPPPLVVPAGTAVVRAATPAELDAAGDVVRVAYTADGHGHPTYLAILADAHDRAVDAEIAVAVDATGDVLGSVTFALPGSRWAELSGGDDEAEFRMLGVRPDARGRGIARALVEWCLARAAQHGRRRVVICSQQDMAAAHRLYTRLGFARRPDLDWTPVPGVDLLGFELDLPR